MLARLRAITLLLLVAAGPVSADFKGYYDVSGLEVPALATPTWGRRYENSRLRYFCVDEGAACRGVLAVEIKGVLRSESMPSAFLPGAPGSALSITELKAQGDANARRLGSLFHGVTPIKIGDISGLRMEASGGLGHGTHFVTVWLGRGDWLLDVKITGSDLDAARALSDEIAKTLAPQVFK